MCSRHKRWFFSGYNQKVRGGPFFKLNSQNWRTNIRSTKIIKKIKFEISIWVKKYQFNFFKNCLFTLLGINFFLGTTKRCANKSFLSWFFFQQGSEVRKKWKTNVINFDLGKKRLVFAIQEVNSFPGTAKVCTLEFFLC